jgi:predicted aminopeptidase
MTWRLAICLPPLVLAAGCETLAYYGQAIGGHLELMAAARPLEAWLAEERTAPELRAKLETARRIRAFATQSLALPDNRSYGSYAELGRPFAVWNVYAAPEFSVEPRTECFPFAGCVAYRGFFSEARAREHAARLRAEGLDVFVGGVPAYSTLGRFDDPLLSTFIGRSDAQVARLVFHELAHQLLYVRDDTAFNESFAAAVENEGVRRWLAAEGRAAELAAYREQRERSRALAAQVEETRLRLAALYRQRIAPQAMRERKRAEFARLRVGREALVPPEADNAWLASVALYTRLVPAFERLLAASGGDLPAFYAKVKEIAALEGPARAAALR